MRPREHFLGDRATVTDEVLNSAWAAAIDAEGLSPVSGPTMDETELVEAGKPYLPRRKPGKLYLRAKSL